MSDKPAPLSYWDYIRVEDLLALQGGVERDDRKLSDDEVRFLVIHQIDELWFKLVLRELTTARDLFARVPVPESDLAFAVAALRRVSTIFGLAAQHFGLMETMRTQDYLKFRDKLHPASGFQSAQMREIEILLGLSGGDRLAFGGENSFKDALKGPGGAPSPALQRVERRERDVPTLKDAVDSWLARTPIDGSTPQDAGDDAVVDAFARAYYQGHERLTEQARSHAISLQALTPADEARLSQRYRAQLESARGHLEALDVPAPDRARKKRLRAAILFVDSHRSLPLLSWPGQVIDALVECEQSMLVFRQRHARMVERVIGRRIGTGGSDGVAYLDQTALTYRVFTEIWAARTMLLPPELCPPVGKREFYGFEHE
ncbi:MAG: tryptophan 2,3-dioxygenase family protein [Planctomycetota bacterium]